MSDPRETLLREGIAAYNRGDTDAVLAALDLEIEVYAPPEVVNAGTFHGHEGYLTWVESWLDAWEEFRIAPVEIEQFGDDFLVHMDARGRGKGQRGGGQSALLVGVHGARRPRHATAAIPGSRDRAGGPQGLIRTWMWSSWKRSGMTTPRGPRSRPRR